MVVDIYIREINGSREIRVPWLPEEIEFTSGGTITATYDIMNKGVAAIPTGTGLVGISWTSVFPGKNRTDKSMMRGSWKAPKTYHNILEDWLKNGAKLNVLATNYPINYDVFIEDYSAKPTGGFGDMEYTIKFTEKRDIKIKTTKVSTNERNSSKSRSTTKTETYTIKPGDTLWGIAEKELGAGSKWKTIYNANKDIIESTAKKRWKAAGINRDSQNGHWIFPGTVIKIPK